MVRVEIEERHMWPLTSSTTCYSGARGFVEHAGASQAEGERKTITPNTFSTSLATNLHTIHVSGLEASSNHVEEPCVKCENADPNFSRVDRICVGYCANSKYQVLALLTGLDNFIHHASSNGSENTTLDPEIAQQLRESLCTIPTEASDTVSVTTATAASVISESSLPTVTHPSRRASSAELDAFSSSDTLPAIADSAHPAAPASTATMTSPFLPSNMEGRLVWKNTNYPASILASLKIDFRPLAMTLACIPIQADTSDNNLVTIPTVWMGSADSNQLYAFSFHKERSELERIPLDHPVFEFLSPIMAMDFIQEGSNFFHLAIACQDGTVRRIQLLHYDQAQQSWSALQISEIIVDGPLVCIQLVPGSTNTLVGSLCGYVMHQDRDGSPTLVASGFEDGSPEAEDSVLAVHGWDSWVAIGTQTGSLFLYHKKEDRHAYVRAGEWHLPYPIHGICHIPGDSLLVTTRRSLHWFTLHYKVSSLDLGLAQQRVQQLLKRVSNDSLRNDLPPAAAESPQASVVLSS